MMIKHGLVSSDCLNPITEYFRIGQRVGSAGPDMVWKIYHATRITDNKVVLTNWDQLSTGPSYIVVELTVKTSRVYLQRTDE